MDVIIAALSLIEFIVYLLAMKEKVHIASEVQILQCTDSATNTETA